MVWHSISPDGSKSVGQNTPTMQENTSYTESILNKDHFWNIGTNQDGRHNQINMPVQSGNLVPSTGMDGVIFLRQASTADPRIQAFYANAGQTVQISPGYLFGDITFSDTNTFLPLSSGSLPDGSYGIIYVFGNTVSNDMTFGTFKKEQGICQAYSTPFTPANFEFGNSTNTAVSGNIKVRRVSAANITYKYRIQFWAI